MHQDYGLRLELAPKLVMTPQLRQAITILQLSSLELAAMVENELVENPVLEIEADADADADGEPAGEILSTAAGERKELLEEYFEWADYFDDGTDIGSQLNPKERPGMETWARSGTSLHSYLELQLHLLSLNPVSQLIGEYIIGCIDDNGYLGVPVDEIARRLGAQPKLVEEVLRAIQTFDPPGVGARDLRECLLIQVRQKCPGDEMVRAVIMHYLDDVAAGRLRYIAERLSSSPAEVQRAVDVIRSLNPKPGLGFSPPEDPGYVNPDVTIKRVGRSYVVIINESAVPRLTINPFYRTVIREADGEAKKYIESRLNAAIWLIRSIEQRRRTLYNVVDAIIDLQRDFFDYGPRYLRPLTMKKVASRIGMHESTVSRATANKYAETPHGIMALRNFFPAGVSAADGSNLCAARVKQEILELVSQENINEPLSDQALAEILAERGIPLARRTVAKYREELGIASSSKRRRY